MDGKHPEVYEEPCEGTQTLPDLRENPSARGARGTVPVTPELLAQEPELCFVAWQDDWTRHGLSAARHPDGTTLTDFVELDLLRNIPVSGCYAGSSSEGGPIPPFLHFWIAHPLFDRQGLISIRLLGEDGDLIPLGANGMTAHNSHPANDVSGGLGWLVATLSPGNRARPAAVAVQLDYAVGPLEKLRRVEPGFRGGMALEGNSQLSAIGTDSNGSSFVALAVNTQDLVQSFFDRFLEKNYLEGLRAERGKFRGFLLASLKHFLANEWDKARRQKRGGGATHLSLDWQRADERYHLDPPDPASPDKAFDRERALALLERVITRLRDECADGGKTALFGQARGYLMVGEKAIPYGEAAHALGVEEGAVRVAVHRLRKRYRQSLREEIAQTLDDPAQVNEELRSLQAALAG